MSAALILTLLGVAAVLVLVLGAWCAMLLHQLDTVRAARDAAKDARDAHQLAYCAMEAKAAHCAAIIRRALPSLPLPPDDAFLIVVELGLDPDTHQLAEVLSANDVPDLRNEES